MHQVNDGNEDHAESTGETMKRVFVYEYLCGGGLVDGDEAASDELLPLGLSMRDAVLADLMRLDDFAVCAATCARVPAPPSPVASVSPHTGESPFDFVARQTAGHDLTWVIAPETGDLLAGFNRVVAPSRWLGCDGAAIRLTSGKRATLRRLAEHGVPTPLAFAHVPEVNRWVVKPDDGAGGVATRVHTREEAARDDWSRRSRAGATMSLEPWVDGEPLSLSLLCTGGRCEMLSINRQHIAIDDTGLLAFQGVEVNAIASTDPRSHPLRALAAQVVQSIPGLRGFVGIDLVWHARCGPVVIEVNPRVTCAYVGLSSALGRNLAAELMRAHLLTHPHTHHAHA
jgi:predicted ATP-grasp superfamily ATP-dependent carboligase